jgi:hypothetical protein
MGLNPIPARLHEQLESGTSAMAARFQRSMPSRTHSLVAAHILSLRQVPLISVELKLHVGVRCGEEK